MATVAPQLVCFFRIFGPGAVALWFVISFWIALFVSLAQAARTRFGPLPCALIAPILWTGLEYFRGELYYLRFSWLNIGYALAGSVFQPILHWTGMYGIGFLCTLSVATVSFLVDTIHLRKHSNPARTRSNDQNPRSLKLNIGFATILFGSLASSVLLQSLSQRLAPTNTTEHQSRLTIAGMQLEFPSEEDIVSALDKLRSSEPGADLLMLSEYSLDGPVPEKIKLWCRDHQRYLLVGGKAPASQNKFYDTAFVIGPDGTVVFDQVKSVPIQFFNDGLPAKHQKTWDSPWGKFGICICYDLSYTRVTDRLVRLGAQALLVPTMDVIDWGRREHLLHARVTPVRAAEYGIPIARLASSGISQIVDASGHALSTAPFPGQNEIVRTTISLSKPGSLPLDRYLAPLSFVLVLVLVVTLVFLHFLRARKSDSQTHSSADSLPGTLGHSTAPSMIKPAAFGPNFELPSNFNFRISSFNR
jgi:apolipoprotein N-acyltransferase